MNWPERYIIIQKYSSCYWYVIKMLKRIAGIDIPLLPDIYIPYFCLYKLC